MDKQTQIVLLIVGEEVREITATQLSRVAVELKGGGYTISQTMAAMQWQSELLAGEEKSIDRDGVTYTFKLKNEQPAS